MQLLQVENRDKSHATTNKSEVAMRGMAETKGVVNNESKKEDSQPQLPQSPKTPSTPQTYELKKNGYLALTRGLGSGVYETGLTSQVSGGLEIFGFQNRDFVGNCGEGIGSSLRQSSIDTEPHTLTTITVKHAKDGAVEIIETYDEEEALHLFLKDAEDDNLREEAMAAILPVAPELVT
ncbi:hypothetical protein M758_7G107400 [Ceratodon purpureus]|uniref:Uncharacterized protein n=1 Tax=Ceratodon purpureus TaxID=3225 RepID=A0A8T0HB32_CERPU|nr:hypothetical protein KC19_7G168900 [Ceratodon purpureus]KAG0611010.1 hypothetical protein M758_7G107400 [Ceratodon purpureus]